jgi:glycosyltransferase involved in cell wall biosynthesis
MTGPSMTGPSMTGPSMTGPSMTGLRVGYVVGTTSGGTGRHAAMLADGCQRAGLTVFAFGPEQTRSMFLAAVAFEPVEITDRPRPARDLMAVLRLRRLLRRSEVDVVHAHGMRAGALAALALGIRSAPPRTGAAPPARPLSQPGLPAGAPPGLPTDSAELPAESPTDWWPGRPALVVSVHNAPPAASTSAAIYVLLERLVARRADAVLCVSADLSARMRRLGAHGVGQAVVPAAATGARPVPADLGADGRPVVLAVGRLTTQKGFGTLLTAAAHWRDRQPEPLLVIAGDGPLAGDLADQANRIGVAARFLGERPDVAALLAAADVFVLPSQWEGQPLVLQEALRAGRPIVAARVGGVPDLTGADAALLVPPGDPAALASAVIQVLDDKDLAARLAAAAQVRAGQLPSGPDAIRAVLEVYGALAAGRT